MGVLWLGQQQRLVFGYAKFDPELHIAGVIFNRVQSSGHFQLLKEAVEAATMVKVVGYLRPNPELTIPDRHLGLRTVLEQRNAHLYQKLGEAAIETIDLDAVELLSQSCDELFAEIVETKEPQIRARKSFNKAIKVGMAYDSAFCFYYQDNLELLQKEGIELILFSPMSNPVLPEVDVLYLGGGYPELHTPKPWNVTGPCVMRFHATLLYEGDQFTQNVGGLMYLGNSSS